MKKILFGAFLLLNIQIANAFSMRFMLLNLPKPVVATGGVITYVDSTDFYPMFIEQKTPELITNTISVKELI